MPLTDFKYFVIAVLIQRAFALFLHQIRARSWFMSVASFLAFGAIAGIFCLFGLSYGPIGAFLPETFATRYRYTGAGLAFNLAGIVGGALPPLVAGALVAAVGSWAVGLLIGGFVLVSIGCTLALPETQGRALAAC